MDAHDLEVSVATSASSNGTSNSVDEVDVSSNQDTHSRSATAPSNTWRTELSDIVSNEHESCYMCNGYYGSNFSQPLCTTCHLFLFPIPNLEEDTEQANLRPAAPSQKDDSEDSGTEEPSELEEEADVEIPAALVDDRPLSALVLREPGAHPLCLDGPGIPGASASNYSPYFKSELLRQRIRDLSEYRRNSVPSDLGSIVQDLPPEVLLQVFNNLNDMGIHTASNVCFKWHDLINAVTTNGQWERYVRRRWPLFKPHFRVDSWKDIYSQLVASAPCQYCIENMKLMNAPSAYERILNQPIRQRRLISERKTLEVDPPEGILAVPLDSKCNFWQAVIHGPKGTPYEGGKFFLYLIIPFSYPLQPPIVQFITKIFHPNVSRHGDIGLDCIHHNWSLALTLSKILLSIQSLLTDPYLKVCMEPSIAKCYQEDIKQYNSIARQWTWKYAKIETQQVLFGMVDGCDNFKVFSSQSI